MTEVDDAALSRLVFGEIVRKVERDFMDVVANEEGRERAGEHDEALQRKYPDMDVEKRLRMAFTRAQRDLDPETDYPDIIKQMKKHNDRHYLPQERSQRRFADTDSESITADEHEEINHEAIGEIARTRGPRALSEEQRKRMTEGAEVQRRRRQGG
jgi:hypothetical protein